jgi:hypothetical protein
MLTLDQMENECDILLASISGSKAYGTDTPESDTDLRGVFILPAERFFGLECIDQVSDEKNDITFFELSRFIHLLCRSNPNILEMLFVPDDCVRSRHPLFDLIDPSVFLSKQCQSAFAGYAMTQIRKARGLNKKIVNPMKEDRKRPIDYCHVLDGQGSVPLSTWLDDHGFSDSRCGLVNVPHMHNINGIYYDRDGTLGFRGVFKDDDATEVRFSSVPKQMEPIAWMHFNKDGFKKHCKQHREYWDWVEDRNENRYATNVEHGRNYDSKNMMHTFRLLDMAAEIATEPRLHVRRPPEHRDFLMQIRAGKYSYDELLDMAEKRLNKVAKLFESSTLPETPDSEKANQILIEIRTAHYAKL